MSREQPMLACPELRELMELRTILTVAGERTSSREGTVAEILVTPSHWSM